MNSLCIVRQITQNHPFVLMISALMVSEKQPLNEKMQKIEFMPILHMYGLFSLSLFPK